MQVTVGQIRTKLAAWMREDVEETVAFDSISDSIKSIWETLVCINLSDLLGGPVEVTFAPASTVGPMNLTTASIPAADSDEGGDTGDVDDIWYIHTLSVKRPDGGELFFEGTEVGSELWRRFARSVAGNSSYQQYVYDFNGSKFTVAPNPATELTPGYFYVKRPPKTVDDSTIIPFDHPGSDVFIRYNSLSLILLSLNEFVGAAEWGNRAEGQRAQIIETSAKKNSRKNLRVQPLFR